MKKFAKAYVRAVSDKTEGLLTGVVGSTAAVDRYGESIDQSSWDLKHYKKNPVILWAHNLTMSEDRPPIGKATKIGIKNNQLVFDIQFDMADPFAADIFRKYKEGFLNAFSVGFICKKVEYEKNSDAPILKDNELLELSAVPVPANPEALNALKARSFHSRAWSTMLKEVESSQDEDAEEVEEEVTEENQSNADDVEVEAEKEEVLVEDTNEEVVEEELVEDVESSESQDPITEVETEGEPQGKNYGGTSAVSKKGQLGSNPRTVEVLRQANRLIQGVLTEINREKRNS